jgi:hypothetical protein
LCLRVLLGRALSLSSSLSLSLSLLLVSFGEVRRELSAAEIAFRKAIEVDPDLAEAHCNLATLLNGKVAPGRSPSRDEKKKEHFPRRELS